MLCAQRCSFIYLTSDYLGFCSLPDYSKQSGHSLTSDKEAFSSTDLKQTGYFLFFTSFSVNQRWPCGKIPVDQQFFNNHDTFKVTVITFLPHSGSQFKFQQIIVTMSTRLNAVLCCHVIG